MRRSVVATLIACLSLGACATTTSWRDAVPATAVLEVSNRSDHVHEVVVRGASEGTVLPGARRRFRWLAPGTAAVTALSKTAPSQATTVELVAGQSTLWELGDVRPTPPPLGSVLVTNTLHRNVVIAANGALHGVILPGDTRTLRDLVVGSTTLAATVPETGLKVTETLDVAEETVVSWRIAPPMGTARVLNDSVETVILFIDERELGQLLPGDTLEIPDIASGDHTLVAVGVPSTVTRRHDFTLQADTPYSWSLSAESGLIEIENQTGEDLRLLTDESTPGELVPAGTRLTMRDVPPGEHVFHARGETTQMPYSETLIVRPGQQVRWHVSSIAATIRVENRTRRPLELYVDATWQGRLDSGALRTVTDLTPGAHELVAVSPDGRKAFRHNIEALALRAATWRINSETATFQIDNQRPEAVMAFIDGRGLGEIPERRALTFTGLETGTRLFEIIGIQTGRTLKRQVVLQGDREERPPETWTVTAPTGSLVITNSSSESLLTEGELTRVTDALAPGATGTFPLPVGSVAVRLIGETSGVPHLREFEVGLDQIMTWDVGATTGHVVVTNSLTEALVVTLGDIPLGTVPPGAELRSNAITAGPHHLSAIGVESATRHSAHRMVGPGIEARWTLQPEPSRLVISNQSSEAISIRIDGRPYGRVEAESTSGFDELIPGQRTVDALGLRSGWRRSMTLTLLDGGSQFINLAAPMAVLVVDNQAGETVTMRVDGELLASVASGTPHPLNVPAGHRKLTAMGQESGHVQSFDIALVIGQSHALIVPRARARLVVVNRMAHVATVRIGDRVLGELAPGGTAIYDDLHAEHWWLTAHDQAGIQTHTEHRTVGPGETRSWILTDSTTDAEAPEPQN